MNNRQTVRTSTVASALGATLLGALLLGGCAAAPTPIPQADSADARAYAQRCGACHSVPHPKRHDMAAWQSLIKVMDQRMTERHMPALAGDERASVMRYLEANSK